MLPKAVRAQGTRQYDVGRGWELFSGETTRDELDDMGIY